MTDQCSKAPETVAIDWDSALDLLEILRLTPIYALLNSESEDQLGEDFKPHKWQGFEVEHAEKSTTAFRALLQTMQLALDEEERR